MSRKKKELPLLERFEITGVAAEGNAFGKMDTPTGQLVVFIPFGAPGDIADVQLIRKKRKYAEGRIVRLIHPSDCREEPKCEHFGTCGGCRWQHLPYQEQLKLKQQHVVDSLTRIGKVELPEISPIIGSPNVWEYRNKMEYTFSNKRWLSFEELKSGVEFSDRDCAGFHIPGAFDKVLDIKSCHLQDDLGNRLRLFIKKIGIENNLSFYDLRNGCGLLRTMMIRIASTGETMLVVVFGQEDKKAIELVMSSLVKEFPELTSLQYVVNTKCNDSIADQDVILYSGERFITEKMGQLQFRVGPKSFYQTNSEGACRLYNVVKDFAQLTGKELVYDLYTGTGTIALFLSNYASKVIGIEYVEEAIDDAKVNSDVNGIKNTVFFAGDMKKVLTDDFVDKYGRPEVIVADPPRAGMHEDVIAVILRAEPQRIVYVSCNPATQARDIALLDSSYKVKAIQPVDMFPHTHHVENVVLLERRQKEL